jgi:hypothetical protein
MMVFAAQLDEGGGPCPGSPHPFTLSTPSTRVMSPIYFIFCRLYPFSPYSHHGSVCFLPVVSLLLANTVPPVRACLIIWWERFRGTQKADDRGPPSIRSSLCQPLHSKAIEIYFSSYLYSNQSPTRGRRERREYGCV